MRSYQRTRLLSTLAFLGVLLAYSHLLIAGSTGKIAGRVIDAVSKEPLMGVNVMIAGTRMGNSTDANGEYFILNVPPGKYSVRFSIIGHEVVTKRDVGVIVDQTTRLDVMLTPTDVEGKEVIVVAERL